jgi:hypothetical protein
LFLVHLDPAGADTSFELVPIVFRERPIHFVVSNWWRSDENRQELAGRRSLHESHRERRTISEQSDKGAAALA